VLSSTNICKQYTPGYICRDWRWHRLHGVIYDTFDSLGANLQQSIFHLYARRVQSRCELGIVPGNLSVFQSHTNPVSQFGQSDWILQIEFSFVSSPMSNTLILIQVMVDKIGLYAKHLNSMDVKFYFLSLSYLGISSLNQSVVLIRIFYRPPSQLALHLIFLSTQIRRTKRTKLTLNVFWTH